MKAFLLLFLSKIEVFKVAFERIYRIMQETEIIKKSLCIHNQSFSVTVKTQESKNEGQFVRLLLVFIVVTYSFQH